MINALIQNGDQTAVLKLPDDPFTLQYDLSQIGVRIRLRDIPIKDDEDSAIQVKLFADSDIGNNLAVLFKPSHSLEDANLCAYMVENARPEISEELEQHIVHGQYYSPQALMADIKAMTEGLIGVTVNYYCPLQIHMTDEEYGDCFEVDNGYGIANEDAIRELVKREQDRDLHNITAQDRHGVWHKGRIRKLMPIECWRLQGFTDEQFNKAAATGLSDGRLYKMAGNAVSVPVISAIGQKIKEIYYEQEKK